MGKLNKFGSAITNIMLFVLSIPWSRAGFFFGIPGAVDDAKSWATVMPAYVYAPMLIAAGIWAGAAWSHELFHFVGAAWPDFAKWDGKDAFELYEAPCLWFDKEPRLPMPRRSRQKYRQWRDDVYAGSLPLTSSPTVRDALNLAWERSCDDEAEREAVTPHSRISRDVLIELAKEGGARPRFLFPHKRGE